MDQREPPRGLAGLPVFYFGASTGAGAALVAAAKLGEQISGVVSRGGRPDLAGAALSRVSAPVLLIVGGADREVLELNRQAAALIRSEVQIAVVPGPDISLKSREHSKRSRESQRSGSEPLLNNPRHISLSKQPNHLPLFNHGNSGPPGGPQDFHLSIFEEI